MTTQPIYHFVKNETTYYTECTETAHGKHRTLYASMVTCPKCRERLDRHAGRAPSYRFGVEWIATNDDPTERDPDNIKSYISTLLLADLYGRTPESVARDIARFRWKIDARTLTPLQRPADRGRAE